MPSKFWTRGTAACTVNNDVTVFVLCILLLKDVDAKNINVCGDTCTSMKKEYKSSKDSICLATEISTTKEEFSLVKEDILWLVLLLY